MDVRHPWSAATGDKWYKHMPKEGPDTFCSELPLLASIEPKFHAARFANEFSQLHAGVAVLKLLFFIGAETFKGCS